MFGFYFRWLSTLFKGPGATRWKERIEVGRSERFGGRAQKLLFEDFPRLVEQEHRINEFLKKFTEFVHDIKKAGENVFNVLFNELTQDMTEEREIDGIIQELKEHWPKLSADSKRVVREFGLSAARTIEAEVNKERAEYKEGSAIINEAQKTRGDVEAFMNKLRTWFKTKQKLRGALEKFTWRREIARSRYGIKETHTVRARLKATLTQLAAENKKGKELDKEFAVELREVIRSIADMFNYSYQVRERAILFIIKLMYLAETADLVTRREINKSFLPKDATGEAEDKLGQAVEHLGKDFHDVIEQEFRINIHNLERESKELKGIAGSP